MADTSSATGAYPVLRYPDPRLKKRAREITMEELRAGRADGVDLRALIARMKVTMLRAEALGLAATQVGVDLRVFLANPDAPRRAPFAVFNPVLSELRGKAEMEEGCLSLPGIRVRLKRAERLLLKGISETGAPLRMEAEGLEARIYQHETDHLDGILLVQRVGPAGRFMLRQALAELEGAYELAKRRRAKTPRRA